MIVVRRAPVVTRSLGDVAADTWPSTGAIDTETASLATSVAELGRDIFDAFGRGTYDVDDPSVQALQNSWNAFLADFNQWQQSAYFWNPSRRDELISYRARFNAQLAQWKGLGAAGVTTAAAAVAGAVAPPSALDQAAKIASSLVWVVGIGAAVWVGATVYKEMRGRL